MRVLLLCLMVVLFVSSCAGAAPPSPAPALPPAATAAIQPTAVLAPTLASASKTASAAPVKTWVETGGFRKSEAKYLAATGRPQFVEFFAFW